MPQLCEACKRLKWTKKDFTTPPFEPEGRYHSVAYSGSFKALRETKETCDLCRIISTSIEHSDRYAFCNARDEDTWSLIWSQSTYDFEPDREDDGEVDVRDLYQSALFPVFGEDACTGDYGIQSMAEKETAGFLAGRLVTDWLDVDMVKGWIERCTALHTQDCGRATLSPADLRVIDVRTMCLVSLPQGAPYATLSYVWGTSNFVVTLRNNEERFKQAGGLDICLPKTIRDAIEVTAALGLRHIWIDSLCITQDDRIRKQALIDNMDMVYTNALITLVAATGNGADTGLSGWSNKRGRNQHYIQFSDELRFGINPYYQRELLYCEHTQRAWTYQETNLSPRCLVFLNGFVYFDCRQAVYCEHTHAEVDGITPENSAGTLGRMDSETTITSFLENYASRVRAYTQRSLKYQSDALNAFTGIAKAMAPSMGISELYFGVPPSSFDWAVMWRGTGPVTRRQGMPSWAWVGWQGSIDMARLHHDDHDQIWLLKATLIDWYSVDQDGGCRLLWDSRRQDNIPSPKAALLQQQPWLGARMAQEEEAEDERSPEDAFEEVEEERYPSYGHSQPGNSFGRMIDWSSLAPLQPPSALASITSCTSSRPGTLCFHAPIITLAINPPPATPTAQHTLFKYKLLHSTGRACGFVSVHREAHFPQNSPVTLIVLSSTSYGDLTAHQNAGLTKEVYDAFDQPDREDCLEQYLETPAYEMNYDYLNVMYLVETGEVAKMVVGGETKEVKSWERAGIGFVLKDVLEDVGEMLWREIVLV